VIVSGGIVNPAMIPAENADSPVAHQQPLGAADSTAIPPTAIPVGTAQSPERAAALIVEIAREDLQK
jgi:hypothetical protein